MQVTDIRKLVAIVKMGMNASAIIHAGSTDLSMVLSLVLLLSQ